jgi:hypothetical protein
MAIFLKEIKALAFNKLEKRDGFPARPLIKSAFKPPDNP